MSQVLLQLDLPSDWQKFQLPGALDTRLQDLLDRQDQVGKLTRAERREAQALTELAEMLTLMKLRAERAARKSKAWAATFRAGWPAKFAKGPAISASNAYSRRFRNRQPFMSTTSCRAPQMALHRSTI